MCGIAGFMIRGRPGRIDGERLERMRDAMAHRGPDDAGLYLSDDGRVGLANRRLSILDLSPAGHQPMSDETGTVWLTFNGEVYNYRELRAELAGRGHRFRTETDTEVVIAAYQEWGEAFLERLNGMWGLALFDTRRDRLLLARDRLGIKPLYYYADGDTFLFASELKPMLESGVLPSREANPAAVVAYLADGAVDGIDETFLARVQRLRPAHRMIVSPGTIAVTPYWALTPAKRAVPESEAIDTFRALFEDSVRLQMRSDVPIGVCLSGGMDSSAIFATLSRFAGQRIKAFTCFYEGRDYDERRFAEAVVKAFDGEMHLTTARGEDFADTLGRLLWYLEEPSVHMGVFSQWHVMRLAQGQVKVVLDGQGGDELLAGYPWYYAMYVRSLARRFGRRPTPANAARLVVEYRHAHSRGRGYAELLRAIAPRLPWRPAGRPVVRGGLSLDYADGHRTATRAPSPFEGSLDQALHASACGNTLQNLLREEDRIAMAFSLENRVPFLDHRLVEYAFALPEAMKIRGGWTKYVLRKAMSGILPDTVVWRRDKKGFPTPVRQWLREQPDTVTDMLFDRRTLARGILDPGAVRLTLDQHVAGQVDASRTIWRWLNLELWFRTFIDAAPVPAPQLSPGVRP